MKTFLLILQILQLIVCVGITVVVLFQSGKKPGLSGAIGGSSDTFLLKNKSKSWDAKLAKMTKWFAVAFAVLTLLLSILG